MANCGTCNHREVCRCFPNPEEYCCDFEPERPHGEWISCSERLPRYNEYVLVYRPQMAIKIIVDSYDKGWTYSKDDAVVAWMPLPEPYKREGE